MDFPGTLFSFYFLFLIFGSVYSSLETLPENKYKNKIQTSSSYHFFFLVNSPGNLSMGTKPSKNCDILCVCVYAELTKMFRRD